MSKPKTLTAQTFETDLFPTWCPGCGDWSIWRSLKQALVEQGHQPHEICVVYGVGCSGNMCSFVNAYGFHGLHGRAVPVAVGIKLANHELPVIVVNGDGDNYGEGLSHWIAAMRGDHDIMHIVHDNMIYGLTTGQTSPTSLKGTRSKSTPAGVIEDQINPMAFALQSGASFVARGFAGEHEHLTELFKRAMQHRGYSFVDVFQPCVTFNKIQTYDWYRERVYLLEEEPGYDPTDYDAAWAKGQQWGERLPVGLFYVDDDPPYHEEIAHLNSPLVKKKLRPGLGKLLDEFV